MLFITDDISHERNVNCYICKNELITKDAVIRLSECGKKFRYYCRMCRI